MPRVTLKSYKFCEKTERPQSEAVGKMLFKIIVCVVITTFAFLLNKVEGHGMMLDPPSRSSAWRFSPDFPINYDDNELFCGGFENMIANGGCGLCGDNLVSPRPRSNENTGFFGTGTVLRQYQAGQVVDVSIMITANHMGHFEYSLCDNGDGTQPEPGEGCFQLLNLENGSQKEILREGVYSIVSRVKLPDGLRCEHCVFRWHWKSGNNWGTCEDGTGALGCGDQETFRNCADIRII